MSARFGDTVAVTRRLTAMEFRLLGPPAVIEQDRVLALGHGRQRSLVAAPLLHANEVVETATAP
jgi:hypothetical protein